MSNSQATKLDICYERLHKTWRQFRAGKKPSASIDAFAYDIETNLNILATSIVSRTYHHDGYRKIVIKEKKRRDLAVAKVPDRVVHRLIYDFLYDSFDPTFDYDVWSCRKNKGLHAALKRTQQMLGRFLEGYVWRADIMKFFDSVNHEKLKECIIRKHPEDAFLIWLCQEVISSYETGSQQCTKTMGCYGIPIGNLTSQIFANIYLHEFDRFVRHQLKPLAYLRYGDDFILFAPTRQASYRFMTRAAQFLSANLELALNPKNNIVVPAVNGLQFLGHTVRHDSVVVDKSTTSTVLNRANLHNVASYKALDLPAESKKQLDWITMDKIFDINEI